MDVPTINLPVLHVEDEGGGAAWFTEAEVGAIVRATESGSLFAALVVSPCPGRGYRGGAGGQVMTACSYCGEIMGSTAGPHSIGGSIVVPVIASWTVDDRGVLVAWRRAVPGYGVDE